MCQPPMGFIINSFSKIRTSK